MNYTVTFVQYYTYDVEAEDEDEACDKAHKEFQSDIHCSVASAWYDDIEIECDDEEEDEY